MSSLEVIPAVDLLGEEAVRLERGRFDRVAVRSHPVELVRRYRDAGAHLIHVVDLDGARSGRIRPELIGRLVAGAEPAQVQASGGVRSVRDAERLLAAGAARVVIATAALSGPDALVPFTASLGAKVGVALDVRHGRLAVAGWQRRADVSLREAVARCREAGVSRLLCTAIERDGLLRGPDRSLIAAVRRATTGFSLAVAGGVRSPDDLSALAALGCDEAIVGRAFLDGVLPLSILAPHRRDYGEAAGSAARFSGIARNRSDKTTNEEGPRDRGPSL